MPSIVSFVSTLSDYTENPAPAKVQLSQVQASGHRRDNDIRHVVTSLLSLVDEGFSHSTKLFSIVCHFEVIYSLSTRLDHGIRAGDQVSM